MSNNTAFWIAIALIVIGFSVDAYYKINRFLDRIFDEEEEE